MPCQCATTTKVVADADTAAHDCGCATESEQGCGCASSPAPPAGETSLERLVMELDKRVRKLEASR